MHFPSTISHSPRRSGVFLIGLQSPRVETAHSPPGEGVVKAQGGSPWALRPRGFRLGDGAALDRRDGHTGAWFIRAAKSAGLAPWGAKTGDEGRERELWRECNRGQCSSKEGLGQVEICRPRVSGLQLPVLMAYFHAVYVRSYVPEMPKAA